MMRAATCDINVYEEVEANPSATGEAVAVGRYGIQERSTALGAVVASPCKT
jgi:hypothetical protein